MNNGPFQRPARGEKSSETQQEQKQQHFLRATLDVSAAAIVNWKQPLCVLGTTTYVQCSGWRQKGDWFLSRNKKPKISIGQATSSSCPLIAVEAAASPLPLNGKWRGERPSRKARGNRRWAFIRPVAHGLPVGWMLSAQATYYLLSLSLSLSWLFFAVVLPILTRECVCERESELYVETMLPGLL